MRERRRRKNEQKEGQRRTEEDMAAALEEDQRGQEEGPSNQALYAEKRAYYQSRIALFEKYFAREQEKIERAKTDNREITVTLPDGKEIKAVANATTPWDVAMGISKKLAQASLIAHVDGNDWDMKRPLRSDCKLRLF